jgi:hypothetical protein
VSYLTPRIFVMFGLTTLQESSRRHVRAASFRHDVLSRRKSALLRANTASLAIDSVTRVSRRVEFS